MQLQVFASSVPSAYPSGTFPHSLHLPPLLAWARAKACLRANTAQPFKTEKPTMSSIATANTTTTQNNLTTLPTTPKPQTSKEVIAANVQLLIEQLEAGHSEALTAYLTAMGRFHNYSFGNILEIARQMPEATRVAGLYAWNQLGRKVIKGQKGNHRFYIALVFPSWFLKGVFPAMSRLLQPIVHEVSR